MDKPSVAQVKRIRDDDRGNSLAIERFQLDCFLRLHQKETVAVAGPHRDFLDTVLPTRDFPLN
jgi:hypothetical protein